MAVFSDSWARLGWVESLAARVLPAALAIDEQGRRGNLQADLRSCEDHDHIRYTLVDPIAVPVDLGFLIADLATNARSCLDMAIEKALQIRDISLAKPLRQFPIEDDIAKPSSRLEELLRVLPEAHQKVIRDLQPTYFVEGLGHMDVPINETALQIRDVSNANKHRNLTPALRTTQSLGFAYPTGTEPAPSLEMVFEREETPLGPFNDDVILELRWPRGTLSDDYVRGIRPATTLRLAAHGSGFMYPRLSTELPIYVVDFARRVPAYVRHALTVLEQAELHDGRPIGAFRPDFDLTL